MFADFYSQMIEVQKLINAYHGKESELSVEIEEMHDKRNIDLTIDDQISRYNILLLKCINFYVNYN